MWRASSADSGSWGGSSPLPTGLARIRSRALKIYTQGAGLRGLHASFCNCHDADRIGQDLQLGTQDRNQKNSGLLNALLCSSSVSLCVVLQVSTCPCPR